MSKNYFTIFLETIDVINSYSSHLCPPLISYFHLLITTQHISNLKKKCFKIVYNSSIFHELKRVSATCISVC